MFKNFENAHPSPTAAFIDGALCAALITYFVSKWRRESNEEKAYTDGFTDAMNKATEMVVAATSDD